MIERTVAWESGLLGPGLALTWACCVTVHRLLPMSGPQHYVNNGFGSDELSVSL